MDFKDFRGDMTTLDGLGGIAQRTSVERLEGVALETGGIGTGAWLSLARDAEFSRGILADQLGLDSSICDALLAEETRPRFQRWGDGWLLILRGVNLNPGAEPEDMVSVRLWVCRDLLVSVQVRGVTALAAVRSSLETGTGPRSVLALVTRIVEGLIERMGPVVNELDEGIGAIEDQLVSEADMSTKLLSEHRIRIIRLRRYIAPQREAQVKLLNERFDWIDDDVRTALRESTDQLMRLVEHLEALREQAQVLQDQIDNRLAQRMNRTMYLLTLISAIMLPLGFVTGLLGINVGGIPAAENPYGFAVVALALMLLAAVELYLFRRLGWL